jgi:hypothetical protein
MSAPAAGTPSGGTGTSRSPSIPRPSRLVARITSRSQERRSASARAAAPSSRCSQLSSTSSSCLLRKNSTKASRVLWPAGAITENTAATASSTPVGSRTGASSHSHAPSPNTGDICPATCNDSRVFPTPPAPVRVTRRASPSAAAVCSSSRARPMTPQYRPAGMSPSRPAAPRRRARPAGSAMRPAQQG